MKDKRRVYYKTNGKVIVYMPLSRIRDGESEQDCLDRVYAKAEKDSQDLLDVAKSKLKVESEKPSPDKKKVAKWKALVEHRKDVLLAGKDYDDVLVSDLPPNYNIETLRGAKGQLLTIDSTVVTQADKRQKIENDLDKELGKANPNAIKALKLQRKLDKRKYD